MYQINFFVHMYTTKVSSDEISPKVLLREEKIKFHQDRGFVEDACGRMRKKDWLSGVIVP